MNINQIDPILCQLRLALESFRSKTLRVLACVSGGMDSMCLLHALFILSQKDEIAVEVCHVNHGLRACSDQDERFVSDFCAANSIKFHLRKLTGAPQGENIENWGRKMRYKFFNEILNSEGLDVCMTAHTASDELETYLMRLISNKELASGIMEFDVSRKVYRPFLKIKRDEIEGYQKNNNVPFVEDPSNQDLSFLRNKIRHRLIPFLKNEFGPETLDSLIYRGLATKDDQETLELLSSVALRSLNPQTFSTGWFKQLAKILKDQEAKFRWKLVETALRPHFRFNLGRKHSNRVVEFLIENRLSVQLPGGWSLKREKGEIFFEQSKELPD